MNIQNESPEYLSLDLIRALFEYNQDTGLFINKLTTGTKAKQGDIAGYITDNNYVELTILSRKYKAHRIAWYYVYERLPTNIIDHIDGDGLNNSINNLREVTYTQNSYNTGVRTDNSTGYKGVSLDKRCNKFRAYITINKKQKSLGYYDTAEEAGLAYIAAARELHGEYYNENTCLR